MNPVKLYIKDIVDGVLDRHIPLTDSISPLLNPDPKKATNSIIRTLRQGLNNLCSYLPMYWMSELTFNSEEFSFKDNYHLYAKGEIPLSELQLIPDAIARVGVGDRSITANFWSYEPPILRCPAGTYTIRAVYKYPMYLEYDSNGLLTANSHIFGVSNDIEMQFNNAIDLAFLKTIKARTKLVNLPISVDFLNFDETIQELKEDIENDKIAASYLAYSYK